MEPLEAPLRQRIVIETTVKAIKQTDNNWFAIFDGSQEWLLVGHDKPDFEQGDRIRITIEKAE
jgi:hypothetical protein